MGIVNVTPDSFSGDGLLSTGEDPAQKAIDLVASGADVIDVGGESTRPGHDRVSLDEELARILPALERIASNVAVPISIDTRKPQVARAALLAGATIVNDVSGLRDAEMATVVSEAGAGLICVHHGRPPRVEDTISVVRADLEHLVALVRGRDVDQSQIVVDPGLGMGKGWRENLAIMHGLDELSSLGLPLLVGPSRKGMIGRVLGLKSSDRMEGSLALVVTAIAAGADIVRIHDVSAMGKAARMADALARWPAPARTQ